MQKTKTACKLMFFLLIVMLLTGCWDREELEEKAYVIGLGLDLSKQKDKIKVSLLIANPEVGSLQGGGGSTEKPKEIITFDANDFITAKNTANALVSRDISYDLLRIIVVSEEFAKDKNFIRWLYDATKDREIRRDTFLAVSKEEANEYFNNNNPVMETRPHKYFQYMINRGIDNGLIPDSTLHRFFKTTEGGTDLFLAMYTTTKKDKNQDIQYEDEYLAGQINATGKIDQTQFIGSAVFKNGVMIDKLDGQETRVVNVLDDTTDIKDILVTVSDPFSDKQRLVIRIMKTKNNTVKMNLKGSKPKIHITLPLTIEVLSDPGMVDFAKSEKNRKILKKHIKNDFTIINENFFKKTQTELKGSPYGLSVYARKYFKTVKEYEDFNWVKSYPEAEINVTISLKISEFGKQVKVMPLNEMRD